MISVCLLIRSRYKLRFYYNFYIIFFMIAIHHDCEIKLTFENKSRLSSMIKRVIQFKYKFK